MEFCPTYPMGHLLPFLGPVLGLLILLSLGHFLFNKILAFIKGQIDAIKASVCRCIPLAGNVRPGRWFDDILTNGP